MHDKLCKFYMTTGCSRTNCKFIHDGSLCKRYYRGECDHSQACKYSHAFDPQTQTDNANTSKSKRERNNRKHRKKNTQSFDPDHSAPDMRLMVVTEKDVYPQDLTESDVIVLPNFFEDKSLYDTLIHEMQHTGFAEDKLWKLWHGDSHLIADDKLGNWKDNCPTFTKLVERISNYFSMDVKATRFNWYKDNQDWKPYHRDAAAIDERKAKTQNITVGITLGATRTASFQHMRTKTRIDIPLSHGSIYVFNKQVNLDWMHGIIQEPTIKKEGRISIICWGYCEQSKHPSGTGN